MIKPLLINNLEFAKKQLKLADSFEVSRLTRLREILALHDKNALKTPVEFELSGHDKQFRHPSLQLHIKTKLPVICQRCLNEMHVNLALSFNYLIGDNVADDVDSDDEIDWVEADSEMNVQELIEDELLLAMPIAPVHENNCTKMSMQSGEKPNPFAILKGKIK